MLGSLGLRDFGVLFWVVCSWLMVVFDVSLNCRTLALWALQIVLRLGGWVGRVCGVAWLVGALVFFG